MCPFKEVKGGPLASPHILRALSGKRGEYAHQEGLRLPRRVARLETTFPESLGVGALTPPCLTSSAADTGTPSSSLRRRGHRVVCAECKGARAFATCAQRPAPGARLPSSSGRHQPRESHDQKTPGQAPPLFSPRFALIARPFPIM